MAKYAGSAMVVKFGTIDVSGQGRALEIDESVNEIDVTSYGSVDKEYIPGKIDRTGRMDILDDATNTGIRTTLAPKATGSLTWFPQGTASGLPKLSCATAFVTGRNNAYPYDDAVTLATTLRLSGPIVEGTAP